MILPLVPPGNMVTKRCDEDLPGLGHLTEECCLVAQLKLVQVAFSASQYQRHFLSNILNTSERGNIVGWSTKKQMRSRFSVTYRLLLIISLIFTFGE